MYQLPVVVSRDNHTGLGGWLALGDCIGQCHIFGFTTYKIQVHQANTTLLLQSSSESVTATYWLCVYITETAAAGERQFYLHPSTERLIK